MKKIYYNVNENGTCLDECPYMRDFQIGSFSCVGGCRWCLDYSDEDKWVKCKKQGETMKSADDYEYLKQISIPSLIDDDACRDGLKLYMNKFFQKGTENRAITAYILEHRPDWISWLETNGYIKLKKREPKVGEVWELTGSKHLIVGGRSHDITWLCFDLEQHGIVSMNFSSEGWKYLCGPKDLVGFMEGL